MNYFYYFCQIRLVEVYYNLTFKERNYRSKQQILQVFMMNREATNNVTGTADQPNKSRLYPVKRALFEENMSYAQLAQACKCTKQNISMRFISDDCKLSDMEKMAEALGYEFTWKLTKKKTKRTKNH